MHKNIINVQGKDLQNSIKPLGIWNVMRMSILHMYNEHCLRGKWIKVIPGGDSDSLGIFNGTAINRFF